MTIAQPGLLPCPLCGGEAAIRQDDAWLDWDVICTDCDLILHCGKKTEAEAIAAWNTRAQQPIIITDREGKQTVHWEPTGWQDIATAPRDGTEILGWDPTAGARVPIWFVDGEWAVCWSAEPNPDCTHWQPLPKPPEE